MLNKLPPLTQLEFSPMDHKKAERIAQKMGYEQTAYSSTSDLNGLYCLPENPERYPNHPHKGCCIIKTKELGFLVVYMPEDLGMPKALWD